jgi:hypothetical protein
MKSKIKFKTNLEYRLIGRAILQVIFYACFSFAYHSLCISCTRAFKIVLSK